MKFLKQIFFIVIVFLKTGNLLSDNNLFTVNNILLEKKDNISINQLANQAIKKAFDNLTSRLLLDEDLSKVNNLNFSDIRKLVSYYNISKESDKKSKNINFSVTFDKDKLHYLFYESKILYSDINDKEFFILPILLKGNEIFIFSNNYFYENWNKIDQNNLIEFILPSENIEIIQTINKSRNNLLDLNLNLLFREYENKNIAVVLIEDSYEVEKNVYIKAKIQNKTVSKNFQYKEKNLEKIIKETKDKITNIVKSRNLIDINTPSFLNTKMNLNKNSNLVQLNSTLNKIDLIEDVFVQEFNKEYVNIRIKYLGKLEKIISQLKKEKISLSQINGEWIIKIM